MEKAFTLGAALRAEKVQKACKINQCDSFREVCIVVESDSEPCIHGKTLASVKGKSFRIAEDHSSQDWNTVFSVRQQGDRVVITVNNHYGIGAAIPTELADLKN